MRNRPFLRPQSLLTLSMILGLGILFGWSRLAHANAPLPPDPQNSSVGVQGTLSSPPPSHPATITIPSNGQSFSSNPITVSGLCTSNLLVKLFANNVFVGSVVCKNGSYSLQIDLFSGRNDLVARVYDALDQAGPDSTTVTVTFNNPQVVGVGAELSLTSDYARRGANPGQTLDWPITLNGGLGPYALSVDWGDGSSPELLSVAFPGPVTIDHVYSTAGTYEVQVKAVDKNGQEAFLQLVGVANGAVSSTNSTGQNSTTITVTKVIWWPAVIGLPLLGVTFWLGQRYELFSLRRRLERSNEN